VSHGHGHGHGPSVGAVRTDRRAVVLLLGFLAVVLVGTLAGLVALWPSGEDAVDDVQYAAEGVTFVDAEVLRVEDACPVIAVGPGLPEPEGGADQPFPENCNTLAARLSEGPEEGDETRVQTEASVVRSGLRAGDEVVLMRVPPVEGQPETVYGFSHPHRDAPLLAMTIVFVVVVAVVARLRGILALVGLGFAAAVLWWFIIPGLLAGESGIGVAVVGSIVIMYVVLYLAHGPSLRTSAALAGTLLGITVTALLGVWAVGAARLSGMSDENGEFLQLYADQLNFKALLSAGIIIAGLGVERRDDHPGLRRLGAALGRPRHDPSRDLRPRHADRPRPHRLDDLHDRVRLRGHGARRAAAALALRPPGRRRALLRHAERGGRAHPGLGHRTGGERPHHDGDRRGDGGPTGSPARRREACAQRSRR
jgi:hypothetical protein